MKKLLLAILFIALLFFAGVYIFIPSKKAVAATLRFACTINGSNRVITDSAAWKAWLLQAASNNNDGSYIINDFSFTPRKKGFNSIQVEISGEDLSIDSRITLLPIKKDSVFLEWRGIHQAGDGPFARIKAYNQRGDIEKSMKMVLEQMRSFAEQNKNIYGSEIQRTKVKDTILIATRVLTPDTPSTKEIYEMIQLLKDYARKEGAQEVSYPMLHTRPEGKLLETMVALPIDKVLKETGKIFQRRLIDGGNLLVTEVTGGPQTIRRAYRELENYILDYRMETPAKPFQSLITDRLVEPDTANWVTKIYHPVF